MSFFNPFRKNQRPEGVKLATMQTPEEAGTAAPHAEPTFGPRTEPSLGRFKEGTQTGGQTAPSAQPTEPPPFDFAEPAAQTAGEQALLLKRLSRRNAKPQRLLRPKQPPGIRMVFMRRRQIKMSPNWVLQPKSSLRRRLLRFWRPRPQALRLRRRLSSCLNRVRNRIRSLRPQPKVKKRKLLNLH